jgi:predicted ribosomally synthesized peptide with SipW-like signal peptide
MGTGRKIIMGGAGRKLLASTALLGAVASVAGMASYATFTDTTSVDQASVASGTVDIALGTTGTTNNRLDIGATAMAAGDTLDRQVKLTNAGNVNLGALTLTTSALTSSVLDTDTTNGLKLSIDSCPTAWTESGPPYTYTCAAGSTTVLAARPVIGSNISLGTLGSSTAGGADYLRVRLQLPATADNTFQGKTSAIRYTFDATQRSATAK